MDKPSQLPPPCSKIKPKNSHICPLGDLIQSQNLILLMISGWNHGIQVLQWLHCKDMWPASHYISPPLHSTKNKLSSKFWGFLKYMLRMEAWNLWPTLRSATRGWTRCFGFTFEDLSFHPSLYTVNLITFHVGNIVILNSCFNFPWPVSSPCECKACAPFDLMPFNIHKAHTWQYKSNPG